MTAQNEVTRVRQLLAQRKIKHTHALSTEMARLTAAAAALGVQRVVVFGSMAQDAPGLSSDLDLLIVWDTPMDFLTRTAALYRQLQPQVAVDLLVYTPDEMARMAQKPFIQQALENGRVLYEA